MTAPIHSKSLTSRVTTVSLVNEGLIQVIGGGIFLTPCRHQPSI
jgi:hypothetical protein